MHTRWEHIRFCLQKLRNSGAERREKKTERIHDLAHILYELCAQRPIRINFVLVSLNMASVEWPLNTVLYRINIYNLCIVWFKKQKGKNESKMTRHSIERKKRVRMSQSFWILSWMVLCVVRVCVSFYVGFILLRFRV